MADSLRASEEGLKKIEEARRKKGWTKSEPAWFELATTSKATLKRFIEGKKPIKKETFIELCKAVGIEDYETIADKSPTQPTASPVSCSAYNEETWVGREGLIRQLSQKLKGQCRVLIITGIAGLGKTALAERLATVELREDYQNYKVVNFDEVTGTQDFVSVAANMLNRMGEKVTADECENPEGLLNRLVQKLQNHPYLVQIDSVEVLLKGKTDDKLALANNEFEDHRWWNFFKRLLKGQDCQSRLILTSQDLPTQFDECSEQEEERWIEKQLTGLNEVEHFEFFGKLFQRKEKEIEPQSEVAAYLKRIGEAYEGHPLVIKVIAREILDQPFQGNVVAYWNRYHQEFEAIESVIGHQKLQQKVKGKVRKSLERLAQDVPNAYTLLYRSSVYRRSVPQSCWLAMLGNLTEEEKAVALGTLQFRYLAFAEEVTSAGQPILRQHNLIRSVAYELLRKKEILQWKDAHYVAAGMWRTAYEPKSDASNLEKVRGYLEAFYHLCKVEDWEEARKIPFIVPSEPPSEEPLHKLLHNWGYYSEQDSLYQQILDSDKELPPSLKVNFLNGRGDTQFWLEHDQQAKDFYETALEIAREIGNQQEEGMALRGLGNLHCRQGAYQIAMNCYKQHYKLARKIGDITQRRKALQNIGIAYQSLDKYKWSIRYIKKSLAISNQNNDLTQAKGLLNLGRNYVYIGKYESAISNLLKCLEVAHKIQAAAVEMEASVCLGIIYRYCREFVKAKKHYDYGFTISSRTSISQTPKHICSKLGVDLDSDLEVITDELNKIQKDIDHLEQLISNNICKLELGNYQCDLGYFYNKKEQFDIALEYSRKALKVFREIGNRGGESYAIGNIGVSLREIDKYDDAIKHFEEAIAIANEEQDSSNKAVQMRDLGITFRKIRMYEKSLDYLHQALEIENLDESRVGYEKTLKELRLTEQEGAES